MPLPKMRLDMSTFKDHKVVKAIKPLLPPLNFITIHYTYFILTCLISSLIFWGLSNPGGSIGYTDSLFLVVSAMTEAGLNTVNLSQVSWILIRVGGEEGGLKGGRWDGRRDGKKKEDGLMTIR